MIMMPYFSKKARSYLDLKYASAAAAEDEE